MRRLPPGTLYLAAAAARAMVAEIGEAAQADLAPFLMAYDQLGQAGDLAPCRSLLFRVATMV